MRATALCNLRTGAITRAACSRQATGNLTQKNRDRHGIRMRKLAKNDLAPNKQAIAGSHTVDE